MRKVLFILITLLGSLKCFAQYPVHDKQKENQIRSMEQGHWDFSPDWWYLSFHKNIVVPPNAGNGMVLSLAGEYILMKVALM